VESRDRIVAEVNLRIRSVMQLTAASRRTNPIEVLRLCLHEARPGVQLLFFLRFSAGAVLAFPAGRMTFSSRLADGAIALVCSALSAYIFNGIADVTEDRINGSKRPIASGALSPRHATIVAGGFVTVAVTAGFASSPATGGTVLGVLALGWLYSGPPWYLKRHPIGSAVLLVSSGILTYLTGCWAARSGRPSADLVVFGLGMALSMGLVGLPAKDLSDIEGDREAGRRTWPIILGERRARRVIAATAIVSGACFAASAGLFATRVVPAAVAVALGMVVIAVVTSKPVSTGSRARQRLAYRIFMVAAYCAHLTVFAVALLRA
jgi:4-hydroxybenzoate polyprenyltransferase